MHIIHSSYQTMSRLSPTLSLSSPASTPTPPHPFRRGIYPPQPSTPILVPSLPLFCGHAACHQHPHHTQSRPYLESRLLHPNLSPLSGRSVWADSTSRRRLAWRSRYLYRRGWVTSIQRQRQRQQYQEQRRRGGPSGHEPSSTLPSCILESPADPRGCVEGRSQTPL